MAGDWIKMRTNLWDDPRVGRLADLTDSSEAAIVGGLYWLWSTADQHTEDGIVHSLTMLQIDRKTSITGFSDALISIGWLADHPEGVRIVNFEEHNGSSAKKRCQTAKRANTFRISNDDVTQSNKKSNALSVTNELPKEEKRREDIKNKELPSGSSKQKKSETRIPDGFPNDDQREFCQQKRPDLDPIEVMANFRDYWLAKAGKDAVKADWPATFRMWVSRHNKVETRRGAPQFKTSLERRAEVGKAMLDELRQGAM